MTRTTPDPVVAVARRLGQAWADHQRAEEASPAAETSEAEAEAWARVEAFEKMLAVTRPTTLAGVAVLICWARVELRNFFAPSEETKPPASPRDIRAFGDVLRMLGYSLDAIMAAGAVDLRALGMDAYVLPADSEADAA